MDGYIKNKKEAIRAVRRNIWGKYSITLPILLLLLIWLFGLASDQHPDKWSHEEIVFSHISQERTGLHRGLSAVLNTTDGRKFVVRMGADDLSERLTSGDTYGIVFSNRIAGVDRMEALSDGDVVIRNLDESIERWEREQQEIVIAIIITLIIEAIAVVLIDRLWCKKEYSKIQKLKADIERRRERVN